jgi:chromosomal replication initiator protein
VGCINCQCEACKWEFSPALPTLKKETRRGSVKQIRHLVMTAFHVNELQLSGRTRTLKVAQARQVAFYLTRELTDLTYPKIGELYKRDHSTVIHAHQVVEKRMERPAFRKLVEGWIAEIEQRC